jgi:hypothetical protein
MNQIDRACQYVSNLWARRAMKLPPQSVSSFHPPDNSVNNLVSNSVNSSVNNSAPQLPVSCIKLTGRIKKKYVSMLTVGACLSLFSYGCGESKIVQCNELITIANKVHEINIETNAEGLNNLANQLDQIKAEMQTAEVSDRQLQEIQARLVDVYAQASQAERDSSVAKSEGDNNSLERASELIQDAISRGDEIAADFTEYCSN